MTDKEKENQSLEDIIEYEGPFGRSVDSDTFWDDFEEELKDQILKNKITKVKIYYNSDKEEEEKYIVGIGFTFENLFTGQIKELEHKGTENVSGMKELVLKPGEYLKQVHINFKDEFDGFCQLGFTTNLNNEIVVGKKNGLDKTIKQNNEDKIFVGSYGYFKEKLEGFGCLFVDRVIYLKSNMFGYLLLRSVVKKDEKFKEEWNKKYKELKTEYQYLWRTMTLPDSVFGKIIKYCIV